MEREHFHCWNELQPVQSFQPLYLIFDANFGSQSVFCAPLLGERQPVFCPLVLGFQVSCNFAVVNVGESRCFKLLDGEKKQISTAGKKSTKKNSLQLVKIKYS